MIKHVNIQTTITINIHMATYYKIDIVVETTTEIEHAKIKYRIKRNNYFLIGSSSTIPIELRTVMISKLNEGPEFKIKAIHPNIINPDIYHFYKEHVDHIKVNDDYIIVQCNSRGEFVVKN